MPADDDAQPDANLAGALAEHERIRRSTDLPPFKGYINGKLIVNGKDWLDRFERSAIIAKWNTNERKILEFEQLLRDAADDWWKGLRDYDDLDLKQWATIRAEFLKNFDPKGTAKTICSNFKDLHQKPNKLVTTFRDRISKVFRKIEDATPDHMKVKAWRAVATISVAGTSDTTTQFKDASRAAPTNRSDASPGASGDHTGCSSAVSSTAATCSNQACAWGFSRSSLAAGSSNPNR